MIRDLFQLITNNHNIEKKKRNVAKIWEFL